MSKKKIYVRVLDTCYQCGHLDWSGLCKFEDKEIVHFAPIPDWCPLEDAPGEETDGGIGD
jgi:hypothetical protein